MADHLPSVAVLANCTHASIAFTLRKSGLFSNVESLELYSLPKESHADKAAALAQSDFILTLEHGSNFGPLATAALRAAYPGKVFALPTPFFSGLMPDMAYLRHGGDIARAPGILGDYHSALILAECQSGLSEEDVVSRYESGQAFERLDVAGVWADSIAELQTRERETEISISDYIEMRRAEGLIAGEFLSFNHPTEGLITHIAQAFVTRALGEGRWIVPLVTSEHNLYRDARWPLHPAVADALGVKTRAELPFKTPDRMGGEEFSRREFARRSYRYFSEGQGPDAFEIATPQYLKARLRQGKSVEREQVKPAPKTANEIVLTHFGRSGSTVLGLQLDQHSRIHWLNEIFSLHYIRSKETYNFTRAQMLEMVAQQTAAARVRNPGVYVGHEIKLMNFLQNPSCNMVDYARALTDSDRFVHVVLRRKNTLKRIFSVYKAMQTKVYHVPATDTGAAAKTYRVDMSNLFDPDTGQRAATLPELIDKAQKRENEVLANFRNLGITYLELSYEDDIEDDPTTAYRKILDHIGLTWEAAKVKLNKTSSSLKQEVVNYPDVEAALKGTKHEWMLA